MHLAWKAAPARVAVNPPYGSVNPQLPEGGLQSGRTSPAGRVLRGGQGPHLRTVEKEDPVEVVRLVLHDAGGQPRMLLHAPVPRLVLAGQLAPVRTRHDGLPGRHTQTLIEGRGAP